MTQTPYSEKRPSAGHSSSHSFSNRPSPSSPDSRLKDPRALPAQDGPRINEAIRALQVRLINEEGNMLGVLSRKEALDAAVEAGLDLVEVAPDSTPPVCKLMDYGKYKYQEQKKQAAARKKQKVIEIKEIKLRPVIDHNDYQVKLKAMKRFIEEGNKVKVTMRFKGREISHQELGFQVLERVRTDMDALVKVEQEPKLEGKQLIMMLAPAKA